MHLRTCTDVRAGPWIRLSTEELMFWTVVEKTLESPLDSKEIKPVNYKWNQPWIFIGMLDWWRSWSSSSLATWSKGPIHWKKPLMLGKIEGRKRRGGQSMTWLDGITNSMEFEQTPGDSEGQGNLACCSPWGRRVGHNWVTEQQQQGYELHTSKNLEITGTYREQPDWGHPVLQLRQSYSRDDIIDFFQVLKTEYPI